ncbi:zincin-like metallopeptidase domain-containing protein [Escherichia coli]
MASAAEKPEKKPFHEALAEKLIEQLRQGSAPWQRPWSPGPAGTGMPMNPTTGKRYKGINALQLMMQGRSDPRWMTYNQAAAEGAQVRKGEKSTPIQYWKFRDERVKKDEGGKPVVDAKGEVVKESFELERPRVFYASVFNAEQIDGLPTLQRQAQTPEQAWEALARAEQMIVATGANIQHVPGDRAFYRPSTDSITMPERGQFASADRYYATGLHELGHWTGHPSRLNRDLAHPFGSEGYAKEELRAEIASMILGDELGIGHDPDQHVAYVGSWIKALQDDPLEIFRAAADAEKIHGFMLDLEQKHVQTQSQVTEESQARKDLEQTEIMDVLEKNTISDSDVAGYSPVASWINLSQTAYESGLKASLHWNDDKYGPDISIKYEDKDGRVLPIHTTMSSEDGKAATFLNNQRLTGNFTDDHQWQSDALNSTIATMHHRDNFHALNVDIDLVMSGVDLPDRQWKTYQAPEVSLIDQLRLSGLHSIADVTGMDPFHFTDTARQRLATVFLVSGPDRDWDVDSGATEEPRSSARDRLAKRFVESAKVLITQRATQQPVVDQEQEQTEMAAPITEKQLVAERWVLSQLSGNMKPAIDRMNERQSLVVLNVIASMLPMNNDNPFWQRHEVAAEAMYEDVDSVAGQMERAQELAEDRLNLIRSTERALPLTSLESIACKALQELRAAQRADSANVPSERVWALNSSFRDAFDPIEMSVPETWTGELQIRGCVKNEFGVEEAIDQPAEFYGVYGQDNEGLHMWVADCEKLEQAEEMAHRLKLIDAYAQALDVDRISKLTAIRESQVSSDPDSSAEEILAAKENTQKAVLAAVIQDAGLQRLIEETAAVQSLQASQGGAVNQNIATEKMWLAVPFAEREQAKEVAGKLPNGGKAIDYDRNAKCWFAVPGADLSKIQRWLPSNQAPQQPPMDPRTEFARAMEEAGLIVERNKEGDHPIMDGERHRVRVVNAKGKKLDGMYVLHGVKDGEKGIPAGFIANNRTGVEFSWKAKGYTFTDADKAQLQAESAANQAKRKAILEVRHAAVSKAIGELLSIAPPASPDHTYLKNKQARPGDLKMVPPDASGLPENSMILIGKTSKESKALREEHEDKLVFTAGDLLLTAEDVHGNVQSVQQIRNNGAKMFAKDSVKQDAFHVVGGNGMEALADVPVLVIGEGYATADTLSQSLEFATVAAFDSGNLPAVAKLLRAEFPDKPILIAGDNDLHQELVDGRNPGKTKAQEAAKAVDGKAIFPVFAPGEQHYPESLGPLDANLAKLNKLPPEQQEAINQMKKFTDFNDLALRSSLGREGLDRQIKSEVNLMLNKHHAITEQREPLTQTNSLEQQPRRSRSVSGL